jgi:hypothetical protein
MTSTESFEHEAFDLDVPEAVSWNTFIVRLRQAEPGGIWRGQALHLPSRETRFVATLTQVTEFLVQHAPGLEIATGVQPPDEQV